MDAKLNHSDLSALLAKTAKMSMAKSEHFTKMFFDLIIEGLEKDGIVKINGLGTFKVSEVASRGSVNVNTGEKFEIKGHKKLTFTPADVLKENVNQPFAMFEPVEVDETYNEDVELDSDTETLSESETPVVADTNEQEATDVKDSGISVVEEITEVHSDYIHIEEEIPATEYPFKETPAIEIIEEEQPYDETETLKDIKEENNLTEIHVHEVETGNNSTVHKEESLTPITLNKSFVDSNVETDKVAEKNETNDVKIETSSDAATTTSEKKRPTWLFAMFTLVVIIATTVFFLHFNKEEITNNGKDDYVIANKSEVTNAVNETKIESIVDTVNTVACIPAESDDTLLDNAETIVEPIEEKEYAFIMDSRLDSRKISSITVADTTLYSITGEYEIHIVTDGDRLTRISAKYYGSKKLWPYIVKHNRLSNPNGLCKGMKLAIPKLEIAE